MNPAHTFDCAPAHTKKSGHWVCADARGMRADAGWLTSVERNVLSPVGLTFRVDNGHPTLALIDRSVVVELVERIDRGASTPSRSFVLPGESDGGARGDGEFPGDAAAERSGPLSDALRDAQHQLHCERAMARDAIAELVALRVRDAEDAAAYRALHRDALKRTAGFHRGVAVRLRRAVNERGGDGSGSARGGASSSPPLRQRNASAVARRKTELRQTLHRSPPRARYRSPPRTRGRSRSMPVPRAPPQPEVRLRTLRSPPRLSPRSVRRVAHASRTNSASTSGRPLPSPAAPLASEVGQSLVRTFIYRYILCESC